MELSRTRGVPISSETLGISGVLDQIEEKHGDRYPVETKHGTAPRDGDYVPRAIPEMLRVFDLMKDQFGGKPPGK